MAPAPAWPISAAQLWGRVGRERARERARRFRRCFLTPPKFQGRNPTIPTNPRLDSGWATGPSICLPNGPAQTGRATAARSIAVSAISTPIAGNRCRQTVTFAANRVRGRTPHPRARHTTSLVVLAAMAGARCVGRQLPSSRPNSDWGGSQSLLGTGKGLFLQLMAAAWTARARGRRSAGLGAGPLGQADRWPVAQPESNLGSVGMVGFRPWNFGGLRKQES